MLVGMDELLQKLQNAVDALVGLECGKVIIGRGTGISLDFGSKFPMKKPLRSRRTGEVIEDNEFEFGLFAVGTPWRVRTSTEVFASWTDDGEADPDIAGELRRVIGTRVIRAELGTPAPDLAIEFENGVILEVFADGTPRSDDDDFDFVFFTRYESISAGWGGRIELERRWLDVDLE
jgi:hypothetical protein